MITVSQMIEELNNLGYSDVTTEGVTNIFNEFVKNKMPLIEKLRLHPNWDEDAMAIVLKENEYERGFNAEYIISFRRWVNGEVNTILETKGNEELWQKYHAIKRKRNKMSDLVYYLKDAQINARALNKVILVDNDNLNSLEIELKHLDNIKYCFEQKYKEYGTKMIRRDEYEKYNKVIETLCYLEKSESNLLTEEQEEYIKDRIGIDIKCVAGEKLTRIIQKACKTVDIDKIKYINDYGTYTRDDGYNRQFAIMANEINPIKYKRITVISVNPLDYWRMSWGKGWTSCHRVESDDAGCYSSGTTSYMLDSSSMIYYVIDEKYEGNTYYAEPKINRAVFAINEDASAMYEGRVYPDGRDGGDTTLSKQFREVMQRVISDIYNVNNNWDNKKGTSICRDYMRHEGTLYPDYQNYNDCNMSFNKSFEKYPRITLGRKPICPICGERHSDEENIVCDDCLEGSVTHCNNCGDRIDHDDYIYDEDTGNEYCCADCAENDDVHYCEDTYDWRSDCYQDDYDGSWYNDEDDKVTTEDGHTYYNAENAENDGYRMTDDGYWYPEDEVVCTEDDVIMLSDDAIYTEDGYYYSSETSCENAGYVKTVSDEWVKEDDAFYDEYNDVWFTEDDAEVETEDGNYFYSGNSAIEAGYTQNENNEWVKGDVA